MAEKYAGLVDIKRHPDGGLILLNYTDLCQRKGVWDEVTRHCRGLIINTNTSEVVALPFQKFFNLDEHPESCLDVLPREPFAVYEKLDGSLGITYRWGGKLALATRGSFDSPQAVRGTELLHEQLDAQHIPDHLTCLFEIIGQGASCVSHHDFEGLVLLSAFNRETGIELSWTEIVQLAEKIGCKTAQVFPFGSLDDVISSRANLPATFEGYVIRFESGYRVKLKGDAYMALSKLASGLSESRILNELAEGTIETFRQKVPEEFIKYMDTTIQDFYQQAARLEAHIDSYLVQVPADIERKTFASWVKAHIPQKYHTAIFRKYGKQPTNWFKLMRDMQ